jgi:xylulokinase
LVELSGVDPSRLPPLDDLDAPAGRLRSDVAADLGLPNGVVVAGGMNDSHADLIATGPLAHGRAGLAIGTTSVLLDLVDHHGADLDHEVVSVPTPFGTYLVWAETGIGGRALEFVLASLVHAADDLGDHTGRDAFAGFDAAVEAAPAGSNGVMFLPWLTGSLAPHNVPSMRGAFLNLGVETRRIDLVRAASEGIGHSLRWLTSSTGPCSRCATPTRRWRGP